MILTWNIMFRKYINISYNKMTYDSHGYIAVLPHIFLWVYKVNYYKYRNKNMEWNVRRICNVYSNIVNINVKNEMYLCEIFLIMYKKENCNVYITNSPYIAHHVLISIIIIIDLVPALE
jgi:hypothetical protein